MKLKLAALCLIVLAVSAQATVISPDNPDIQYRGRWDMASPTAPRCAWPGTTIVANFEGTSIKATFDDQATSNYIYHIIDDGVAVKLNLARRSTQYTLASGLTDTVHKIEIVKLTMGDYFAFEGFELDAGKNLVAPPARPSLKLEFYGDSHASAHSCECTCDSGAAEYNNAYFSYPAVTARILGAEFHNQGWSGIGITVGSNPMPQVFDRTIQESSTPVWDFNQYQADAIIINLGANDVWGGASQAQIMTAMEDFITNDLRPVQPNAHVVIANSYGWDFNESANYIDQIAANLASGGDTNVSTVVFPWMWSQQHAVICEHAGHANILAAHLATELGLPAPTLADYSCIPDPETMANGGFEDDTLPDTQADGWRVFASNGGVGEVVDDPANAHSGNRYMNITDGGNGWAGTWMSTDGVPGQTYTATGYIKATQGSSAKLRLEFKDQGQNIIAQTEGIKTVTGSWAQYSTVGTAPAGTWNVTIVCVVDAGSTTAQYDDIALTIGGTGSYCGDATCDPGEDQCNCSADCGTPPATESNCTDGIDEDCDGGADCADPTGDCDTDPSCQSACNNNGTCETGEDCNNCPNDCISKTSGNPNSQYCCGDGTCEGAEDSSNCAVDCGSGPVCGDGTCDPGEDNSNCPADCPPPACNNNSICESGEDCNNCGNDCDGVTGGNPANRYCCGNGVAETPEGDGTICDGNY